MEKTCYKLVCFIFLLLCPVLLKAQTTHANLTDITGKLIPAMSYTDVQGNPYLTDKWGYGLVKLANGTSYQGVLLKYDQVVDELLFKDKNGRELGFVNQVMEFQLNYIENDLPRERFFRSGYPAVDRNTSKTFYEVLYNGSLQLLKKTVKTIAETKPYNSATTVRSFTEVESLYVFKDNQMSRLKRDRKSLVAALGKDPDQIAKFIKDNDLNFKNDADLISLAAFSETL